MKYTDYHIIELAREIEKLRADCQGYSGWPEFEKDYWITSRHLWHKQKRMKKFGKG